MAESSRPGWPRSVVPADAYAFRGLPDRRTRAGVGCPVVLRMRPPAAPGGLLLFPPGGVALPATAVASFGEEPAAGGHPLLRLTLLDPRARAEAPVGGGRTLPLAADFSAPHGVMAGRANLRPDSIAFLLDPAAAEDRTGLYLLSPLRPRADAAGAGPRPQEQPAHLVGGDRRGPRRTPCCGTDSRSAPSTTPPGPPSRRAPRSCGGCCGCCGCCGRPAPRSTRADATPGGRLGRRGSLDGRAARPDAGEVDRSAGRRPGGRALPRGGA